MKKLVALISLLLFFAISFAASAANPVTSVEQLHISIGAAATSATASTTLGQTAANCVLFATWYSTDLADWDDQQIDFSISGTTVTASRQGGGGSVESSISVVEFNPSLVRVQQGTWDIAASAASGTASISDVDQTKAALVFYSKSNAATAENVRYNSVIGDFTSDTQLTFTRYDGASGSLTGTYYVFEDLTDAVFTVQAFDGQFLSSDTNKSVTLGSAVDMSKSFVVASSRTDDGTSGPHQIMFGVRLDTTTTVLGHRRAGASDDNSLFSGFVISFVDASASVQRGLINDSTANLIDISITTVPEGRSTAWVPIMSGGIMGSDSSSSTGSHRGVTKMRAFLEEVVDPFDQIAIERLTSSAGPDTFDGDWEVIVWPNNAAPTSRHSILVH